MKQNITRDFYCKNCEFVDELPEYSIEVPSYSNHKLKGYYYCTTEEHFYHFTGKNYRRVIVSLKRNKYLYARVRDVNGMQVDICYESFKKQYEDQF